MRRTPTPAPRGVSAGSPGVGSGNTVQVPVHVPVNACGNTVDVIGLLNPVFGNHCANTSSGLNGTGGGATAKGGTAHSPGVGSGNTVQVTDATSRSTRAATPPTWRRC